MKGIPERFLLSKELQVWLFLQPFQHNPTPRPQRPGFTQLTRQPVQVWATSALMAVARPARPAGPRPSPRRLRPSPPAAPRRRSRSLRAGPGPVTSLRPNPDTHRRAAGRPRLPSAPAGRSATPGPGSSRAARRRLLGGCDKRRHSSRSSHLGTSGSGGHGLHAADVSDSDVSARHAPRRGPRDAPLLPRPVPPHSHDPAPQPPPLFSTAHPWGPSPRPPAQSGARAPLWDVARVMLALSPGLFWPEDVRKVGSLPADPRKGSVLNDRRQQVPRPRSATGLLREPEGRLGAGAFLASCRWTPKPGRRAEGHRACAGRPRGLRVRGSRRLD